MWHILSFTLTIALLLTENNTGHHRISSLPTHDLTHQVESFTDRYYKIQTQRIVTLLLREFLNIMLLTPCPITPLLH